MKYVYILESLDAEHFYVGMTDDLRARLAKAQRWRGTAYVEAPTLAATNLLCV